MRIEKFLKTSPAFSLYVAYDRIVTALQTELSSEGLNFIQALILTGLFFEESPIRPSTLADTLGSTRSNVSHALKDLERKGLIERSLLKGDARAYLIALTRLGRRKAPRLIKIFDANQERLEKLGGKSLNNELVQFIEKITVS